MRGYSQYQGLLIWQQGTPTNGSALIAPDICLQMLAVACSCLCTLLYFPVEGDQALSDGSSCVASISFDLAPSSPWIVFSQVCTFAHPVWVWHSFTTHYESILPKEYMRAGCPRANAYITLTIFIIRKDCSAKNTDSDRDLTVK